MPVSISELQNRVFLGLAAAAEYLALDDVANAVIQRLNALTMMSRTSDINVLLATTAEFTPNAIPYDITTLIGKSVPKWLETRSITYGGVAWWSPVRNVPLDQLSDYQRAGIFAVAFHGEEPASSSAQATQYMSCTYLPTGVPSSVCRIRYNRDGQRTAMDADILLPDNLSELVVLQAQNSLVQRIAFEIVNRSRKDPTLAPIANTLIATLEGIKAQNIEDMQPLAAQWAVWAYRDREAATSFNKPTPSPGENYAGPSRGTINGYGGLGGGS